MFEYSQWCSHFFCPAFSRVCTSVSCAPWSAIHRQGTQTYGTLAVVVTATVHLHIAQCAHGEGMHREYLKLSRACFWSNELCMHYCIACIIVCLFHPALQQRFKFSCQLSCPKPASIDQHKPSLVHIPANQRLADTPLPSYSEIPSSLVSTARCRPTP